MHAPYTCVENINQPTLNSLPFIENVLFCISCSSWTRNCVLFCSPFRRTTVVFMCSSRSLCTSCLVALTSSNSCFQSDVRVEVELDPKELFKTYLALKINQIDMQLCRQCMQPLQVPSRNEPLGLLRPLILQQLAHRSVISSSRLVNLMLFHIVTDSMTN